MHITGLIWKMFIAIVVVMGSGSRRCYSAAGVDSGFMRSVLAVLGIRCIVETGQCEKNLAVQYVLKDKLKCMFC